MKLRGTHLGALTLIALGGCATKGDLRRVEDEVTLSRAEMARQDSARAVRLNEVVLLEQRIMDSLTAGQAALSGVRRDLLALRGDLSGDLYDVQQQLVQVQALTGQSQQRLTELRTQLEARSEQINPVPPGGTATTPAGGDSATVRSPAPAGPSAAQMYETSLQQLRRGSPATARMGFRQMLQAWPTDARVPDALYFIGESFAADAPDSAALYYGQVVQNSPTSARASTSLYKLGLLAERRRDTDVARGFYQRVINDYPRSDEAALARDRLKSLGR